MGKIKDLAGQKFGRLTAIEYLGKNKWLCKCECGNEVEVRGTFLQNGHTQSCGCYHKEQARAYSTKHGMKGTRLYRIWNRMKDRCNNVNNYDYARYGERGIKVCDAWLTDFEAFHDWAMNNGYQDGLTIDRIDVDGNYEPDNCRWATSKQQARNTTRNRYYTINGETHCLSEWCEILNLKYSKISKRITRYKWPIEQALELEERHHE